MYKIDKQKKRASFLILFMMIATMMLAVPAKRGIWQELKLKDGTTVLAELKGDEWFHYWQTADGMFIITQEDGYAMVKDVDAWKQGVRSKANGVRSRRTARKQIHGFPSYIGKKRGIIILIEFANMKFKSGHNVQFYENVANKVGFKSNEGYIGSVRDYFLDQSGGLFDLTFDVIGPATLSHNYDYYGENDSEGYDKRPGEMMAEALEKVDSLVNYGDYDWDGDGMVDIVMAIYAGGGEADGGGVNSIWPHEWDLSSSDYRNVKILDGVTINNYACANEMASKKTTGIGTICHEFSHGLGLPDMYDLQYEGNYGMGSWSVMDSGAYGGDGFCPSGYTSFEKMSCGWLEPVVLTNDTTINGMKSQSSGGEAYLLQNEGWKDEYYLIENRQKTGWDAGLPGSGMLIIHVDYDENVWFQNEVNTTSQKKSVTHNTHQRCTIFHADNSTKRESADTYPYMDNNKLTAVSTPAATLYHSNADGTNFMGKSITDITQNEDGTMSFAIGPQQYEIDGIAQQQAPNRMQENKASIYSLDGRYLGNDMQRMNPGLYIVGGRKVVK